MFRNHHTSAMEVIKGFLDQKQIGFVIEVGVHETTGTTAQIYLEVQIKGTNFLCKINCIGMVNDKWFITDIIVFDNHGNHLTNAAWVNKLIPIP